MKEKIKKYLPDTLFLLGVFILSYLSIKSWKPFPSVFEPKYIEEYKILGIMLIALSIVIGIRYFTKK